MSFSLTEAHEGDSVGPPDEGEGHVVAGGVNTERNQVSCRVHLIWKALEIPVPKAEVF